MARETAGAVVTMAEPVEDESKFRFLRSRNKISVDNGYHPTHNEKALADIPDILEDAVAVSVEEPDREEPTITPSKYQLTDEDASTLKQAITHLPFETILRIFAFYHYNVQITIAVAHQMVEPKLMPTTAKEMFVANIPIERDQNPTKKTDYKDFYMAKSFKKVVNNKTLVDFYYGEKNKAKGNWRLEQDNMQPMTSEERRALEAKMTAGGLSIVRKDTPGIIRTSKTAKKPAQNKKPTPSRPESGQSKEVDSDTASVASSTIEKSRTGSPEPASVTMCTAATSPIQMEIETVETQTSLESISFATQTVEQVTTCTFATSPIHIEEEEVAKPDDVLTCTIALSPFHLDVEDVKEVATSPMHVEEEVKVEAVETVNAANSPLYLIDDVVEVATSPIHIQEDVVETATSPIHMPEDVKEEKPINHAATSPVHFEEEKDVKKNAGTQTPMPLALPPQPSGERTEFHVETEASSPPKVKKSKKHSSRSEEKRQKRKLEKKLKKRQSTPLPSSEDFEDLLCTPEPKSTSSTITVSSEESTTPPPKPNFKICIRDILARQKAEAEARAKAEADLLKSPESSTSSASEESIYERKSSEPSTSEPKKRTSESSTSSASVSSDGTQKKKYRKKTIEELRGGEQKIYPDRERKAKKFFEDGV